MQYIIYFNTYVIELYTPKKLGFGYGFGHTQILKLPRYPTQTQHPIPKKLSINTHTHTRILIKLGFFVKIFIKYNFYPTHTQNPTFNNYINQTNARALYTKKVGLLLGKNYI